MRPEDKRYILENIKKKSISQLSKELRIRERKIKKLLEREKKKKGASIKETEGFVKKDNTVLFLVLIMIVGFTVYSNSLKGEFVWDDTYLVKNNMYIRDLSYLPKLFTENIGAGAGKDYRAIRPVQMITYMVDYKLWKLNPAGYHLTNTILHILVAITLYFLVFLLFKNNLLSLLTSLLFVAHPVHTEAVACISGRADSLASGFMLLSFICYIKQRDKVKFTWYTVMVLSFIAAALSRESSLVFPLALLLYHLSFKEKLKPTLFLSIISIVLIYILSRLNLLKQVLPLSPPSTTLMQRIPGFFVAFLNYLRLLILPIGLHMEYGLKVFSFTNAYVISGMLVLSLTVLYALRQREKENLVFFSAGWFFVFLLPQANLYPLTAYMAEHWLYVPSIGFFLIIGNIFSQGYRSKRYRALFAGLIVGIVGFYCCLTFGQNNYWRTPFTLYERTLAFAPQSPTVYNNLALLYHSNGHSPKAISLYQKAIEIDPNHYQAYSNLGNLYQDIGKTKEAIASYEKAIDIRPDYAKAYNNLGNLYSDINNSRRAVTFFKKALEIDPRLVEAYNNLGRAYYQLGEYGQAENFFKTAVSLKPDYANAYNNLSILYFKMKKYELSITYCDKARELGFVDKALLDALKPYRK